MDENLKIKIINKLYPIISFFPQKSLKDNIRCEFHEDRKASSKVYLDANAVWCFTCHRFFYPINYIRLRKLDINKIYEEVENMYSGENIIDVYNSFQNSPAKQAPKFYVRKTDKSIIEYTNDFFSSKKESKTEKNTDSI